MPLAPLFQPKPSCNGINNSDGRRSRNICLILIIATKMTKHQYDRAWRSVKGVRGSEPTTTGLGAQEEKKWLTSPVSMTPVESPTSVKPKSQTEGKETKRSRKTQSGIFYLHPRENLRGNAEAGSRSTSSQRRVYENGTWRTSTTTTTSSSTTNPSQLTFVQSGCVIGIVHSRLSSCHD